MDEFQPRLGEFISWCRERGILVGIEWGWCVYTGYAKGQELVCQLYHPGGSGAKLYSIGLRYFSRNYELHATALKNMQRDIESLLFSVG